MSQFFVLVLQNFLLPALLLGVLWSMRSAPAPRALCLVSVAEIAAGLWLGAHYPAGQTWALASAIAQWGVLALTVLAIFVRSPVLGYVTQGALMLVAGLRWGLNPVLKTLSPTSVVNSDLLLNLGAVAAAFVVLLTLAWLVGWMSRRLPSGGATLLAALCLLVAWPLAGELGLALVKLQVLPLARGLLSFIAYTTNYAGAVTYLALAATALFVLAYGVAVVLPQRRARASQPTPIARRQAEAHYRASRRALTSALVLLPASASVQWYWKAIASRPPQLSAATRLTLGADGKIHVPLAPLRDGKLHRFAWVSDEGKVVRFFIVNRYTDKLRLGVVFDACLLCGDQGYAQQGDQIVCVACGVYMFTPSIGKAGGCNPVPIEAWEMATDEVTIPRASLEAGLNLFTTIEEIAVTDPVGGARLKNTTAPFKYSYAERTYFFATEANFEAFRDAPEKYVKGP
ncbi:MAG: Fe-S-containing protein [Rhodocyclaceae bacterium]